MTTTLLDAVTRLQAALDSLAAALAAGEPDAVLAAEEPVAAAVSSLTAFRRRDADRAPGLAEALARVRAAMQRCEALGESAAQLSLAVFGTSTYDRRGLQLVGGAARRVTSAT